MAELRSAEVTRVDAGTAVLASTTGALTVPTPERPMISIEPGMPVTIIDLGDGLPIYCWGRLHDTARDAD